MSRLLPSIIGLLFFFVSHISAQVVAGVTDNMLVNDNTPAETVNIVPLILPGQFMPEAWDSLDLNRDGQYDVLLYCSSCNDVDCIGGSTAISSLHANVEFAADNSNNIRKMSAGDTIANNPNWKKADYDALISRFYGIGGYTQLGNWFPGQEGYAGVRIISGQDTIYGWLKIKAIANPNGGAQVQIFQWAIEDPDQFNSAVDFIIAGVSNGLVPGNKTLVLEQGPIPFGGGAGKIDSVDLNQDGLYDMAFNAVVCNTFDCQQGSAYAIGMHPNISFVNGPTWVKRYEEQDTIFANNNWSTPSGLYTFGLLVQSGLGFNNFQAEGEWLNQGPGYLGFRLITPAADTLFGWVYLYAYSLNENGAYLEVLGWAIQHDPSQKPYAAISITPHQSFYCPGDTVVFQAVTVGADQAAWHFWDGTSDTAGTVMKILPDSTVSATFEAVNQNGATTTVQDFALSPLAIDVEDVLLTCFQPTDTLHALTNIPADIWWIFGNDTIFGPTAPVILPGFIGVFAQDTYGCMVSEQVEIQVDATVPDVVVEYDETNLLLIAYSAVPDVLFAWTGGASTEPVFGDSVVVTQSGTYTVTATAPNGCTSTTAISIVITTSATEPATEVFDIRPNPASDIIWMENRRSFDLEYRIFDAAGSHRRSSGTIPANSIIQIDVRSLPCGLYWMTAYDSMGKLLLFRKFEKF